METGRRHRETRRRCRGPEALAARAAAEAEISEDADAATPRQSGGGDAEMPADGRRVTSVGHAAAAAAAAVSAPTSSASAAGGDAEARASRAGWPPVERQRRRTAPSRTAPPLPPPPTADSAAYLD